MPSDGHAYTEARRHALRALLAHADLSALLVTKPVNVRYLTGFSGSYGALLLLHDRTVFFTDGRYRHQAAAEVPDAEVVLAPGDLIGPVGGVVRTAGDGLGFEPAGLTWGDGQRLRSGLPGQAVVPAPPLVEELREVKDERELTAMREAARLGDEALAGLLPTLREGVTERQVAVDLDLAMRRLGGESLAFDTIVAFGEQAAEPHHHPGGRPLAAGDLVELDFGARVDGYCANLARSMVLGRASQRQRDLYEVVRHAQAAGLTVAAENVDALRQGFSAMAEAGGAETPALDVDAVTPLGEITPRLAEEIASLAPFGPGNAAPVLAASGARVRESRRVGDGSHLRMVLECHQHATSHTAIAFRQGELDPGVGATVDVAYRPELSEWRGERRLELNVCAILRTECSAALPSSR